MYRLYFCLSTQHDPLLVILALLVCCLAATAGVLLLRRGLGEAENGAPGGNALWLVSAGGAVALGMWATHFVAMLAYDPGVGIGYRLAPTLLSLLVALVANCGACLAMARRPGGRLAWGALAGAGLAAMHYIGVSAVDLPGHLLWDGAMVAASVAAGVAAGMAFLGASGLTARPSGAVLGGALLVLGVVLLHFIGMAAITLAPGGGVVAPHSALSPMAMGATVGMVVLLLMTMVVAGVAASLRTEVLLNASERKFAILAHGISDCALYMLDPAGVVSSWNVGAERLKGYAESEAVGLPLSHFYTPEAQSAGTPEKALEVARLTGKYTAEGWRVRKDGARFWAHVTIERLSDERGGLRGFAKITRDMSRFKQDEDRLRALSASLDAALTHMHQGLCLYDATGHLVLCNRRFREIYRLPMDLELVGQPLAKVVRHALVALRGAEYADVRLQLGLAMTQECLARGEGDAFAVEYPGGLHVFVAHRPLPDGGWVSTFEDITEQRRSLDRIAHMALHDEMTGLPNRAHFNDRLETMLARAGAEGRKVAMAAIDLDRFKEVNDTWGHAAGDAMLCTLAGRMADGRREGELVARLGGDEFVACKIFDHDSEMEEFLARLETQLVTPYDAQGTTFMPGASVGVAIYPGDGTTREQVLNNADLAMYRAKVTVGGNICYYEAGMDEKARRRRQIGNDLREAIARGELFVAYQVQRSIGSGAITGYEALLRWHHPVRGWVAPDDFISVAEETGEILKIGEWVLREACMAAARWSEPHKVAVNLSPVQLMQTGLVEMVLSALAESGLPASRLELEITETAIIGDKIRALHTLRGIKAMGVTIAIDDFGTGYSSLDTLNSFPFDKIKIDRSFLQESNQSPQARAIIRAVLALGHSLQVPVLAEGVESREQLDMLRLEGCDEAQGYLLGRPEISGRIPEKGELASVG